MKLKDIPTLRLFNQQLSISQSKTPQDIVGWMGAMQAQDYEMSKWAIGIRLGDTTNEMVETAIARGEILRTHVLRPTWHFVSANDIYWMLELTAPHIKSAMNARHKQLELDEKIFAKSNQVIEKALANGKHLTREELGAEFVQAKIATDENRLSHLLARAELEGIVCSGVTKNSKPTYALLAERVPKKKSFVREESLALLATKYFASHSPATIQDFTWWSGLSVGDARRALEMIKPNLVAETINAETFWLVNSILPPKPQPATLTLPAYDEFIISYRDRSAVLTSEQLVQAVSSNGIFYPVLIVDNQVVGLWKRSIKQDSVSVAVRLFQPIGQAKKKRVEQAADKFGRFMGKPVQLDIR